MSSARGPRFARPRTSKRMKADILGDRLGKLVPCGIAQLGMSFFLCGIAQLNGFLVAGLRSSGCSRNGFLVAGLHGSECSRLCGLLGWGCSSWSALRDCTARDVVTGCVFSVAPSSDVRARWLQVPVAPDVQGKRVG